MDCVFCKIRDGQVPSFKICEDSRTLAFMDINPLSQGHCLVIAKNHAATIFDAEVTDLQAAIATVKKVALAVREIGAHRVLYGSDMPFHDPAFDMARIQHADIPEEGKKLIMGENAKRLLDSLGK